MSGAHRPSSYRIRSRGSAPLAPHILSALETPEGKAELLRTHGVNQQPGAHVLELGDCTLVCWQPFELRCARFGLAPMPIRNLCHEQLLHLEVEGRAEGEGGSDWRQLHVSRAEIRSLGHACLRDDKQPYRLTFAETSHAICTLAVIADCGRQRPDLSNAVS